MARTDPQVNLRIPAELKARIDAAAMEAGRSMNAEVVARLEQSFDSDGKLQELMSHLKEELPRQASFHHALLREYTHLISSVVNIRPDSHAENKLALRIAEFEKKVLASIDRVTEDYGLPKIASSRKSS